MKATICKSSLYLPVFLATTMSIANGFSNVALSRQSVEIATTTTLGVATEAENDFGSATPTDVDPHDIIGVEPDLLAIGINPDEFLEWIGT